MIKGFLESRRKKKLVDQLLGYVSVEVKKSYANTIGDERSHVNNEIASLNQTVIEIVESESPKRLLRLKLRESLAVHSTMQILALTPTEKRDAFYSECTYISASFSHRLDRILPNIGNYKEIWFDQQLMLLSNSEVLRLCNHAALTAGIRGNIINVMRVWLDPESVNPNTDWFRKVLLANLIIAECQIRDDLGEPSNLSEDRTEEVLIRTSIGLLAEEYLINRVDPYGEWKMQLRDSSDYLTDLGLSIRP